MPEFVVHSFDEYLLIVWQLAAAIPGPACVVGARKWESVLDTSVSQPWVVEAGGSRAQGHALQ